MRDFRFRRGKYNGKLERKDGDNEKEVQLAVFCELRSPISYHPSLRVQGGVW
jgi:hypothetical protein